MKDIRSVPPERLGSVAETADGRSMVQFVRRMPYTAEQLWHAITDPDSLATWFPGFQLERRQGGTFNIWFGGECEGPAHVSGVVSVYDPAVELRCGTMQWRLEPASDGSQLTFVDVLQFGQGQVSDYEITNSVLAGWHFYLDRLEDALAGAMDADDAGEYDYSRIAVQGRAAARTSAPN